MSKYGEPEEYSRFLRADWLSKSNTEVKLKAFLPRENLHTQRLEISCFETQNLDINSIKNIFVDNNILLNNKPPFAHSTIKENNFIEISHNYSIIKLDKNYIPDRHIDIIGWEEHKDDELKLKSIATDIAESSSKCIVVY